MTIDLSGYNRPVKAGPVSIEISRAHPLIRLANDIPWEQFVEIVVEDLKKTTAGGFWYMGRKIKVRIHLGAYLLQRLYNLTDRRIEYQMKDNAAFQLFCGLNIVNGWQTLDHTKIERFRNRLSPETERNLANTLAKVAVDLGFADPREVDFDSTVQEANVAYPSDANLMCKLVGIGKKFIDFSKENLKIPDIPSVNLKKVKEKAREYFFLAKNKSIEIKREVFKKLHGIVKAQMLPVVNLCNQLSGAQIKALPWNIHRAFNQIKKDCWRYLLDVGHFIRNHTIKDGKILSFHAQALSCIKKGKVGKEFEFGRVFQLGRIKGNFLFAIESASIQMNDKECFVSLLKEHAALFGENRIETLATDKGYSSRQNQKKIILMGLKTEGLQKPVNMKHNTKLNLALQERLRDRRAGIEPLIGHTKQGGQLGKSRMKSDTATLAAGYGSISGFNLRQLIRCRQGKMKSLA